MTRKQDLVRRLQDGSVTALLFDLDGVLTPTIDLHKAAWADLFTPFLGSRGAEPYTEADYHAHVDGKARMDGVASVLASRGIALPLGGPDQSAEGADTVWSLAEEKNAAFSRILQEQGINPYPGSAAFLRWVSRFPDVKRAVVSSSKNAATVLQMSGLARYFPVVVDGTFAAEEGLEGKPSPETYLKAAELLGSRPEQAVVLEDALAGVAAGRAGNFGRVIGVDRGVGASALTESGADFTVEDLEELIPSGFKQ